MRIAALLLGCCVALSGLAPARAQNELEVAPSKSDPLVYGQYPIAYQVLTERWLKTALRDPESAMIEWLGEPKPGEYRAGKNARYVGYLVDFKVNSRNQFGTYTGKQLYRVVIKNGDVLWGGHPRS